MGDAEFLRPLHLNETITIPNNPVIATVLESIWHGGPKAQEQARGWVEKDRSPSFSRKGRHGGSITIYFDPENARRIEVCHDDLWDQVKSVSALTSDVLLALLAELFLQREQTDETRIFRDPVVISESKLLEYKGVQGRRKSALLERLVEEIERLCALRIDADRYPVWVGVGEDRRKLRVDWQGDCLFEAVRLDGPETKVKDSGHASWLVRPGLWARWWFDARGRRYVSPLPRLLLSLDHRRTRSCSLLSKKIGERVLLLHNLSRSSKPLELTIAELLSMVGELPRPECRGRHWAGRVRERFDEAMLTLEHAGVLASVTWPDGFGPGDPDRYRGWVDRWLSARILIQPGIRHSRITARTRQCCAQANTGNTASGRKDLRAIRAWWGWTQKMLAEHLGISPSLLSKIENGRAHPSDALLEKLSHWLAHHTL